METSIFLARIFGVYMLIVSLVVLKNKKRQELINELSKHEDLRFVMGPFTLIFGLVLVNIHNIWGEGYKTVITIVSWIVLIKGVLVVWLDEKNYRKLMDKISKPNLLTAIGVINLILGLYFTYIGFFI
ncbi:MAG TPA: hypothetical protein QGH03_01485 [Candidatus Paceibacterota bacterium]|jgi:vacuolar-type H+-ATPase subunit I/STV1|nr:hypothetical protein [Candidatus Paceibacterota bacterium]HJN62886.1 hypothetical protein [Candidatus Paceibacterota bacterium]|tara:strand:- start:726 stop:1109 length:384 start_codon:yes stop_codon:yes gene_type:complete